MPVNKNSMRGGQESFLKSKKLELIGSDDFEYEEISFDATSQALLNAALDYCLTAQDKLRAVDRVGSGALLESIVPTQIEIHGTIFSIGVELVSYYKFVDQGVKGWQSGGGNSPFQFKPPGHSGVKKSKFVDSIKKWLISNGKATRTAPVKSSMRDSKRKQAAKLDATTRSAIIIAAQIRRRGLEPTNFWTDTEKEMITKLKDKFGLALKIDIINNICP